MHYTLLKIDLIDRLLEADFYDDDAYTTINESVDLELLLVQAVMQFVDLNPNKDNICLNDLMIIDSEGKRLFRASRVMNRSEMVLNSLNLAMKYHKGQLRKGDNLTQYIRHILEIVWLISQYEDDDIVIASAFCHDLLEDTECTEQEIEQKCGKDVLNIVKAVSNDSELEGKDKWVKKKLTYISSVKEGGTKAMLVCLADKIVNLYSLQSALEKRGNEVWSKFNQGKDMKYWFESECYKMLIDQLSHPLVEIYKNLIDSVYKDV